MSPPFLRFFACLLLLLAAATAAATASATAAASGFVFHDLNDNKRREPGEPGLPGVLVSNQIEVTKTASDGSWSLPARDDTIFFVIKPRGWMPPVNPRQLPQFFYIHKPLGSPPSRFPGVRPAGPLPPSIDFPLRPRPEPPRFRAIFFGDTQSRDLRELDYMARDSVRELIGADASFGVTLGELGTRQLAFLENLLPHFPEDQLLVLMMHIPLFASDSPAERTADRHALFRLIENRPYTMSIAGHTHWHAHLFLDRRAGWNGPRPRHHLVNVTALIMRGEPARHIPPPQPQKPVHSCFPSPMHLRPCCGHPWLLAHSRFSDSNPSLPKEP